MAGATIAPSLPSLEQHFADEPNADYWVRIILTAPGLFTALAAPFAGIIADKVGRRVLLVLGVVLYVIAGSSGLWLDGLAEILIGRAFLGLSVGMTLVCSMALLTDHYAGAERDRVMGVQASAMSLGGILFITAGALLADISWRGPFAVYLVPLGLIPFIYFFISKPPAQEAEPGAVEGVFPFLHAFLIYGIGFFSLVIFYTIPAQLPYYAQELGADSLKTAGFAIALSQITMAAGSLLYRRFRGSFGNWFILAFSFTAVAIGFFILSMATSLVSMYLAMPFIGIGLGLNYPNMSTWLMSRVPSTMRGRASGGLSTSIFIGQFASPFVSLPISNAYGLGVAYFWMGLACLVIMVLPAIVMARSRTNTLRDLF